MSYDKRRRLEPRPHTVQRFSSIGWLVDDAKVWSYDSKRYREFYVETTGKNHQQGLVIFRVRR